MDKTDDSQKQAPLLMDELHSFMKTIDKSREELQPLVDFHKAMESSRGNDLRMIWDVKIVQGEDTPFASVMGSSSMPHALARKMVPLAPSNIQTEIHQKIIEPLMNAVLDKLESLEVESLSQQ